MTDGNNNTEILPNLIAPWRSGQSGNPAGRPKGIPDRRTIAKRLSELLEKPTRFEDFLTPEAAKKVSVLFPDMDGTTLADVLCMRAVTIAATGDDKTALRAFKEIVDRLEGTPQKNINIESTQTIEFYTLNIDAEGDDEDQEDIIDVTPEGNDGEETQE